MNHKLQTAPNQLLLEELSELSVDEICRACQARAEQIIELIQEGVLSPAGKAPEQWRFTGVHLHRVRVALRLQGDLGVNPAGAALALELLDEIQTLRAQLRVLGGPI